MPDNSRALACLARTELVSVDHKSMVYFIQRRTELNKRTLTFEYAYDKASKLYTELDMLGLIPGVRGVSRDNMGLIAGFDDWKRISILAETICEREGIQLYSMLHPQFIGLEGCRVKTIWNGIHKDFWISIAGVNVLQHIGGNAKGSRGIRLRGYYDLVERMDE